MVESNDFAACGIGVLHKRLEFSLVYKRLMVKLLRADGGCLGTRRRRRTWQAAKSFGEPLTGCDPEVSEWGNPAEFKLRHSQLNT